MLLREWMITGSVFALISGGAVQCSGAAMAARAARGAGGCAAGGVAARSADDAVALRSIGSEVGGWRGADGLGAAKPSTGLRGAQGKGMPEGAMIGLSDDSVHGGRLLPEEVSTTRATKSTKLDENKLREIAEDGLDVGGDLMDLALDGESLDLEPLELLIEGTEDTEALADGDAGTRWSQRRFVTTLPRTLDGWGRRPHAPPSERVFEFDGLVDRAGAEHDVPGDADAVVSAIAEGEAGGVTVLLSGVRKLARDPELVLQSGSMRASDLARACVRSQQTCIVLACDAYDEGLVDCAQLAARTYENATKLDAATLYPALRASSSPPLGLWRILVHRDLDDPETKPKVRLLRSTWP